VTVKAGPQHSRGYESLVSGSLQKDKLQEVTSNLTTDLKAEALVTFLDAVKDGLSIAACISRVQDQVLHKVPNQRCKFFVKFVYDNQLQIEIGVNKFKNGNAQYYHRLGVQPRETPEEAERKSECLKRRQAMQELCQGGSPAASRLKKQVTNDRSAPIVSVEQWATVRLPPNRTNKQTARDLEGRGLQEPTSTNYGINRRPKELGLVNRNPPFHAYWDKYDHKMRKATEPSSLRSRSLGRPQFQQQPPQGNGSEDVRDRSASPLGPGGAPRRGLGDCFRGGIRPSQARLRKASPSPVGRKVSTGTFELEKDGERERLKNVKLGEEVLNKDVPDIKNSAKSPTKFIKIVIQAKPAERIDQEEASSSSSSSSSSRSTSRSSSSSSLGAEWRENCLEIEEMPESPSEEHHQPVLELPQEDSWSPSPCQESHSDEQANMKVEFLQPSTIFLTDTEAGMVEEPLDSSQQDGCEGALEEYPIQNFRNRAQRQDQPLQPIFKKSFRPMKIHQNDTMTETETSKQADGGVTVHKPEKQSPSLMDCQSMGPFFSQPFKPVQVQQWRDGMEMLGKPTFTAPSSVGNQVESHSAAEASRQTPSQQFGQHSQHLGPLGQHSQHLGPLGQLNFQPTHATSQLGQIDFGTNAESDDSGWVTIPIQRL